MKLEYVKYSLQNLSRRRLRSWLTVLSILIGIASIYSLVSFGQGISKYVNEISEEAGADKLIVQAKGIGAPGLDTTFKLDQSDLDVVRGTNGIDEATAIQIRSGEIGFGNKKSFAFVMGIPTEPKEKRLVEESFAGIDIIKGRDLKKGDGFKAVLGYNYQIPEKVFKKAIKLGDKISINSFEFDVIGFYEEMGNPQDDINIYLTKETAEEIFNIPKDEFHYMVARASKGQEPRKLAEKVQEKLRKHKGLKEGQEDFFLQTFEQLIETFGNILAIINGVLVLIALISLVVAGVNIMNTMYTSVLERTKEIGIMKAIGAENKDIRNIFIFESGFLGAIGGALGIILGYLIAKAGGAIAAAYGFAALKPTFPLWLIIGCLLFAFSVGALSGFLPAMQASKLKPVDALRYE